jgi:hypothetical protein
MKKTMSLASISLSDDSIRDVSCGRNSHVIPHPDTTGEQATQEESPWKAEVDLVKEEGSESSFYGGKR